MSFKQKNIGQKWCEYCRTGINFTKEDIAFHEQSKKHLKNKEREMEFRRQKVIRGQEEAEKKTQDPTLLMIQEIEKKAHEAMNRTHAQNHQAAATAAGIIIPTEKKQPEIIPANAIGPVSKGETKGLTEEDLKQLRKQKKREELGSEFGSSYEESDSEDDRDLVFEDDIIPGKQPTSLQNDTSKAQLSEKFERTWYLSKEEHTGRLFFYNQISQAKRYQKPIGLKLLEEEQQIWDDYLLEQSEKNENRYQQKSGESSDDDERNNENKGDAAVEGEVDSEEEKARLRKMPTIIHTNQNEGAIQSEWIEVEEEDNFFTKYADQPLVTQPITSRKVEGGDILDDDDEDDDEQIVGGGRLDKKELIKMARIELKIDAGEITNEKQMIEALLEDEVAAPGETSNFSVSTRKKNEKLKKLIENDLDVYNSRTQHVFKKKDWLDDSSTKAPQQQQQQQKQQQKSNQSSTITKTPVQSSVGQIAGGKRPADTTNDDKESKPSLFKKRVNNNKNVQKLDAVDF